MKRGIDLGKLGIKPEQRIAAWLREHDAPPQIMAAFAEIVGKLPPAPIRRVRPPKAEVEWLIDWLASQIKVRDKKVWGALELLEGERELHGLSALRTTKSKAIALAATLKGETLRGLKEARHPQRKRVK